MQMKVARNDPCPCGSGKKFKKCCADKEVARVVVPDVNSIISLFQAGRYADAESAALELLQAHPASGMAWGLLGGAQHMQGKDGLAAMFKAAELQPDSAEAQKNLGFLLQGRGRYADAVRAYQRALALQPSYAAVHFNLSVAQQSMGQIADALTSIETAIRLQPGHAEQLYVQALLMNSQGRLSDAGRALHAAITAGRTTESGIKSSIMLAVLNYLQGDMAEAAILLSDTHPLLVSAPAHLHYQEKAYHRYLSSLLQWHRERPRPPQAAGTVHVIGESHALGLHGVLLEVDGQMMVGSSSWIIGCKQWHLGQSAPNKYQYAFERAMRSLPAGNTVLLVIGEIDCRYGDGIFKAWRKGRGTDLREMMIRTVSAYVNYVSRIAQECGLRLILAGVPDSEADLSGEPQENVLRYLDLIVQFNRLLAEQCRSHRMGFLDVQLLRDIPVTSGLSWHIDEHHLQPSAWAAAFSKCYVPAESGN
jgi:tetratricopeptide (TPR) repeat protein